MSISVRDGGRDKLRSDRPLGLYVALLYLTISHIEKTGYTTHGRPYIKFEDKNKIILALAVKYSFFL